MNITKPSLTELLICEQNDDLGIPASPTWHEVRGKSEAATGGSTKEESGEFSDYNGVTELIKTSQEPKQPFTINVTGDTAEKILMEAALSGDFDADGILKAGLTDKLIATRRVIINDKGSYVTDIENCVVNMGLSIVGKQLHSASVDCQGTRITKRALQYGYQVASGTPNKLFGGHQSAWLNLATGLLYQRSLRTWATTASNVSNAFVAEANWTVVTTNPTTTTGTEGWIFNTVLGTLYWDTGVALSVPSLVLTWLPTGSSWLYGEVAPTTEGSRNSMYILWGDGTDLSHGNIYQKIFNGITDVWTLVMNLNLTPLASTPWYSGNTIIAKSTNAIMTFPHARNLIVMNVIGAKCVNDISFNIDNSFSAEFGLCTTNIGKSFPNYGAIGYSRGKRKITGNFASYFYDDELEKIEDSNSTMYFEFMISNGTQAYRIQLPKVNLEGEPQSGDANGSSVKADYKYTATIDSTFETEMQITAIDDISAYPPLYWGWVVDEEAIVMATDHLESMTNYLGQIKIPTKPAGDWYFVICTPATEAAITTLINTGTGLDELSDYAEAVATQELVTGVDYNVNASADTSTIPTAAEIFIINR